MPLEKKLGWLPSVGTASSTVEEEEKQYRTIKKIYLKNLQYFATRGLSPSACRDSWVKMAVWHKPQNKKVGFKRRLTLKCMESERMDTFKLSNWLCLCTPHVWTILVCFLNNNKKHIILYVTTSLSFLFVLEISELKLIPVFYWTILYSVTQGSRAPCAKARALARCAAALGERPATFMSSSVCERRTNKAESTTWNCDAASFECKFLLKKKKKKSITRILNKFESLCLRLRPRLCVLLTIYWLAFESSPAIHTSIHPFIQDGVSIPSVNGTVT